MTEQEKLRREQLWTSLGTEKQRQMTEEYRKLREWGRDQRRRREQELKEKGEWQEYGLDANQNKFLDIIEEEKKRLLDLQKKYGL